MTDTRGPLRAFIDESGQRAKTKFSSDHFVLSAVIIADEDMPRSTALLAQVRSDLRRRPGDALSWKNIKSHSQRLYLAKALSEQNWLTVSSVVVCKRHLTGGDSMDEDQLYLYTFRLLLERLSWFARDQGRVLEYTLAHIVRFKIEKLREYENRLRSVPDCQVAWPFLDPHGGRLEQPATLEQLQLADAAASATAAGFNVDDYGNTETRYLAELAPRLYRRGEAPLTSYGLKMHPWRDTTKAAYPWVAAL
ncbi:DUF3800 domain-containing protein [Lentzea terrae]|uniref:DUF3800 domain-containing protein n=1 Tax=Lentzea terrae TaxID=2200761 RepID=UPI00130087A3|nr:DUF3800 domain-containing protein [Lentzea terrae]